MMRKLVLFIILVMASICRADGFPPDGNYLNIWHVSTTGDDSGGGHTYDAAKLTISAAISAASAGDTIIIWPGTYDEAVDASSKALKITGYSEVGRIYCIINPTSSPDTALKIDSGSIVKNLKLVGGNSASDQALNADSKNNILIENCYLDASPSTSGTVDAVYAVGSTDITIRNCYLKSTYDVINIGGCNHFLIEDCHLEGDGSNTDGRGLVSTSGGYGVIRDSTIEIAITASNAFTSEGIYWASGQLVVDNCIIRSTTSGSATGNANGIYGSTGVDIIVTDSTIYANSSSGSEYDLNLVMGGVPFTDRCYVNNSHYSTTTGSGFVYYFDSDNYDIIKSSGTGDVNAIWTLAKLADDIIKSGGTGDANAIWTLSKSFNDILKINGTGDPNAIWTAAKSILEDTETTLPATLATIESYTDPNDLLAQSDFNDCMADQLETYDPPTRAELTTDKAEIIAEVNDVENKVDTLPEDTADAVFAETGVTEGGTWTFGDYVKYSAAWLMGDWQDKSGETGVVEILDAEDQTTPVIDVNTNSSSPYKEVDFR